MARGEGVEGRYSMRFRFPLSAQAGVAECSYGGRDELSCLDTRIIRKRVNRELIHRRLTYRRKGLRLDCLHLSAKIELILTKKHDLVKTRQGHIVRSTRSFTQGQRRTSSGWLSKYSMVPTALSCRKKRHSDAHSENINVSQN